ncbi:MAG: DeoR/GlpR family DNA-binding transcription regulator [Lachnospiraceae bacterium]
MKEMKELPYTRQQKILEQLNRNDCVKIEQLAKDFNVSNMTIYRDILQLEKSGDALRVYGGVKAANKAAPGTDGETRVPHNTIPSVLKPYCDSTIEERFHRQMEEKRAIAKVAASYVKDGDVIAIDPSTTTLHMCSYLLNRKITVVTTSMSVALQLTSSKFIDVILCGGVVRKSALSIVGSLLPSVLKQIRINKCFLSSHGFTFEHGLTDMTMEECDAKKQLLNRSNEVYVLIDHTKINQYSSFVVCDVEDMTRIITDSATQKIKEKKEIMQKCIEAGCKVTYAKDRMGTG